MPEAELRLGGALAASDADEKLGTQEFWMWLALAALLLLAIEWYVYHRRLQVPTLLGATRRPDQISMGTASKFLSLITDSSAFPRSV